MNLNFYLQACPYAMRLSLAVLLFLLLFGGSSHAAAVRWYHIEIIVFKNTDQNAVGGEIWPKIGELPNFSNSMELLNDLPTFSDEPGFASGVNSNEPIAFKMLDRKEIKLEGVMRRLRQASQYQPLYHVAWRQPGFGGARARRIYLSNRRVKTMANGEPGTAGFEPQVTRPDFEGIFKLRTGRLLNIDVDFAFYHEQTAVRLTESRKIKFKELHYFDHPLFGIIVQVSPYRIEPRPNLIDAAAN